MNVDDLKWFELQELRFALRDGGSLTITRQGDNLFVGNADQGSRDIFVDDVWMADGTAVDIGLPSHE